MSIMYVILLRKREIQPRLNTMPTFWNLKEIDRLMAEQGIPTQQELNRRAGLSRLTMHNISRSGSLGRIDVPTMEALARVLHLRGEARWRLFTVTDD